MPPKKRGRSDAAVHSNNVSVAVVDADIDPKTFFSNFVATRTPCIIRGQLVDDEWKGSHMFYILRLNFCVL